MRVLIIRFSSFGDIFQALEAAATLADSGAVEFVDWLTREDFAPLLENQKPIRTVISFSRRSSVFDLIALAWRLAPRYDHVYDAHSNLRSFIVRSVMRLRWGLGQQSVVVRSKERLRRFLFFRLRLRTLPQPYRGAESYVRPLRKWLPDLVPDFSKVSWDAPETETPLLAAFRSWKARDSASIIALAPSAAWPNKRWPVERWRLFIVEWIRIEPRARFLLLGGPDDHFLDSIATEFGPERVFNVVAKSSLLESTTLVSKSTAVVANDTGLLHVADRLQIPSVVIVGPTAFGYPVAPASRVAEVSPEILPCKPCSKDGRDRCTNSVQLKCLIDIAPSRVTSELKEALAASHERNA